MLIYCAHPRFSSTPGLDTLAGVVAAWINKKARGTLKGADLISTSSSRLPDDSTVATWALVDAWPKAIAIRYSHADRAVAGRQWVTEIGFRQSDASSDIDCSLLLKTDEISARVWAPVSPTRPLLVLDLLAAGNPTRTTPGQRTFTLSVRDAEAFDYIVKDRDRRHPLVVVSPTADGRSLVDAAVLQAQLAAIADVVLITPGSDTRALARVLGDDVTPFDGGISIVYPLRPPRILSAWRLTPQRLAEVRSAGGTPENEVLSLILHRVNLPNSWEHIAPEIVREAALDREVRRRREEAAASGPTKEYLDFLEEQYNAKAKEVDSLKDHVRKLEEEAVEQNDEERRLVFQIESLRSDLDRVKVRAKAGAQDSSLRELVCAAIDRRAKVSDALNLIKQLFPDRIVVLPSAESAAEKSAGFRYTEKSFDLLWRLATTYWESIAGGKGDAEARQIFGAAFAASESEPVERNRKARSLRTFDYCGRVIEMMTHLKIGIKDSAAETLRIHFEWIAEEKKIVIGHCGPHLDFG